MRLARRDSNRTEGWGGHCRLSDAQVRIYRYGEPDVRRRITAVTHRCCTAGRFRGTLAAFFRPTDTCAHGRFIRYETAYPSNRGGCRGRRVVRRHIGLSSAEFARCAGGHSRRSIPFAGTPTTAIRGVGSRGAEQEVSERTVATAQTGRQRRPGRLQSQMSAGPVTVRAHRSTSVRRRNARCDIAVRARKRSRRRTMACAH